MDHKIQTLKQILIHQSRPITCIEISANLILASEGSVLHVYDNYSKKLVASQVVCDPPKPIHNFSLNEIPAKNEILVFVNLKRGAKILKFHETDRRFTNFLQDDQEQLLNDSHVISARWINNGRTVAALSNENFLHLIQLPSSDCHSTFGSSGCTLTTRKGVGTSLFSAYLHGDSEKDLIVFSGTNLGQIYVWAPCDTTACFHILIDSIKGSVLSISFSATNQTLIASSDERTAYTWAFDTPLTARNLQGNKVIAGNVIVMTGHTGRVWATDASNSLVVTAGQDGKALLWTVDGQLLRMFSHASVFSIRSCKFDKDTSSVILGSDDGSVYQWLFESHVKTETIFSGTAEDYPRQVIFHQDSAVMLSSQKGHISKVSTQLLPPSSNTIFSHPDLDDYNVMALSPDSSIIAIGSKSGTLHVLHPMGNRSVSNFHSKIVSIVWLCSDRLLVATTKQVVLLAIEPNFSLDLKCTFVVNWKDKPGVSSAILLKKDNKEYLVLSDEYGKMHVVHLRCDVQTDSTLAQVVLVTPKAHGSYGVCEMHRGFTDHLDEFWTVGRSKLVKKWKFLGLEASSSLAKLECIQTLTSRIAWNSRMFWKSGRLILVGFAENDFVIYDQSQDIIVQKIPCGGAHRSWDIKIDEEDVFQFAYLRNKSVHIVTGSPGSKVLKPSGTSGKTINVVLNVPNLHDSSFIRFILAGEDGILKLMQCPLPNENLIQTPQLTEFEERANFKDHISSVRAVSAFSIRTDKLLVFSGGGRSQLIASAIDFSTTPPTWTFQTSLIIPPKTSDSNTTVDMRIMDISAFSRQDYKDSLEILCACSDGFFRLLKYQSTLLDQKFKNNLLIVEIATPIERSSPLHAITVAQVLLNILPRKEHLALVANSIGQLSALTLEDSDAIRPEYSVQASRSSIISLQVATLNDIVYVITGADDGHVKFWAVSFSERAVKELRLMNESGDHHCAAVNCICIEGSFVFAASADGIVSKTELGTWQTETYQTGVMDVQSFSVSVREDSVYLIAAGQGVEVVRITS